MCRISVVPFAISPADRYGKQGSERVDTLSHIPTKSISCVPRAEPGPVLPKIPRFDQKYHPVSKQRFPILGPIKIPCIRILDRTADMVFVAIEAGEVRRVVESTFVGL